VLAALQEEGRSLQFAALELRSDRAFVREAIKVDARAALRFSAVEFRSDRELVLEAVKLHGGSLLDAADELKADREVVLEAVKQYGWALRDAAPQFRSDREIVLEAVTQHPDALQLASQELQSDREVVLEAVKRDGTSLMWAAAELQSDRDVVLRAVRQNDNAFRFASRELRTDLTLGAADSMIAHEGETAPVYTLTATESCEGQAVVEALAMSGQVWRGYYVVFPTLNDVATDLVRHHGGCSRVFLVSLKSGSASPWSWASHVVDFV
jgi:hypothetical protein